MVLHGSQRQVLSYKSSWVTNLTQRNPTTRHWPVHRIFFFRDPKISTGTNLHYLMLPHIFLILSFLQFIPLFIYLFICVSSLNYVIMYRTKCKLFFIIFFTITLICIYVCCYMCISCLLIQVHNVNIISTPKVYKHFEH